VSKRAAERPPFSRIRLSASSCDAGVTRARKPAPHFGTIARFSIPKIDETRRPFHVVRDHETVNER
jgi:hypothetical protein